MNIKKSSMQMLSLVFGVSVILYIFDAPILPTTQKIVPTTFVPSTLVPSQSKALQPTTSQKSYSETVTYDPEGRFETITVNIKLDNGIVTELISQHSMNDGKSRRYQVAFEAEIQPLVVGKDIKTLNVSRVAGASFTTDAFMQAIRNIQSKI